MKTTRIWGLVIFLVLLIVLICLGLFASATPSLDNKIATAKAGTATFEAEQAQVTQTEMAAQAEMAQTERAATAQMAQTLTAVPTSTLIPTGTPIPTSTPTLTPTATATQADVIISCPARITGTSRVMYGAPGGGPLRNSQILAKDTEVTIIGRLQDRGWYQAKYGSVIGWLRSDFFTFLGSCTPNTYDLSYLLEMMITGEELILDETFAGGKIKWVDGDDKPVFPIITEYGDYQLVLAARDGIRYVLPENPDSRTSLTAFTLVTSFWRSNVDLDSYVGIRFRRSGDNYYEIRILSTSRGGNCIVQVFETNKKYHEITVDPGKNSCGSDGLEDYLEISLSNEYDLGIRINDSDTIPISLRDPHGIYTSGRIEMVASKIFSGFSYLVITAPK